MTRSYSFVASKRLLLGSGEIVMELSWKSWEKLFICVTREGHLKIGDLPQFKFFPWHIKAKYKIQIVKNNRLPFWPFVGNLEENESGCWESLSWSGGDSQKKTNKCSKSSQLTATHFINFHLMEILMNTKLLQMWLSRSNGAWSALIWDQLGNLD